jgi:hypothetical protein
MWIIWVEQHEMTAGTVAFRATAAERLHTTESRPDGEGLMRVTIEHMRDEACAEALHALYGSLLRR